MTRPEASRQMVRTFFDAALRAVDPYRAVDRHCGHLRSLIETEGCGKVVMVSVGKAAAAMARALVDCVGSYLWAGIVLTKYRHVGSHTFPPGVSVVESGHPIPDENGVRAAGKVLELVQGGDPQTLVVFLISGGGSALLCAPCRGISLAQKQIVTGLLLNAGADIGELNTVRKHLSAVKGGRLAEAAYPGRVVSLVLSDVIGDPLDVIASGPAVPDPSTFADCLKVVDKYRLAEAMPSEVMEVLDLGAQGVIPETPKPGNPIFDQVESIVVGNNAAAVAAAGEAAADAGYAASVLSTALAGEASQVGRELAQMALERLSLMRAGEKACLVAGGETTVTVTGNGRGGRNTELALAFAREIEGRAGITFLSAGTDGTDGPTDAAGAIVNGETIADARRLGLDPLDFLARNDSYTFFHAIDGLVITGPTGTNVMDVQLILLEK